MIPEHIDSKGTVGPVEPGRLRHLAHQVTILKKPHNKIETTHDRSC